MLSVFHSNGQHDSLVGDKNNSVSEIESPTAEDTLLFFTDTAFDFNSVESISYKLYLDKNWTELDSYSKRAIKKGFDYYYLRVRAGIAAFELQKYRKAITNFKKALEFNANDYFAMSYLYYSYLYSEQFEEAKRLTTKFTPEQNDNLFGKQLSAIDYVIFENGLKHSDSSRTFKNPYFGSLGLAHSISKRVFLFHNLNFYNQSESRFNVQQLQYYLKATMPLKKGWLISAGLHGISMNLDERHVVTSTYTSTYQTGGGTVQPGSPPPPPIQINTITTEVPTELITHTTKFNFVTAFSLLKHEEYFDVGFGASYAAFDTTYQYAGNSSFVFYPLRNNKFSMGGNIYLHSEKTGNLHVAVAPLVTFYPINKLHIALSYFENSGPNITENTGSFVSNSIDYTIWRTSLTCSYKLASSLWVYMLLAYENKKHISGNFLYNYQTGLIGFKLIPGFK